MKKALLLILIIFFGLADLSAQEPLVKTFEIGDGGIVKIEPAGLGFNIQIIYSKAQDAPKVVRENLKDTISTGAPRDIRLTFTVKLLGEGGNQVCQQHFLLSDFSLDDTNDPPAIVLNSQTEECGVNSFARVNSVVVDYNSY
jgi:hypothetical protein